MPDDRFGRIAMDQGFLTPERLDECLKTQEALREKGEDVELGQVLLTRGYLTKSQWLEVLAIQKQIPFVCSYCEFLFDKRELDPNGLLECPKCGRTLTAPRRNGSAAP